MEKIMETLRSNVQFYYFSNIQSYWYGFGYFACNKEALPTKFSNHEKWLIPSVLIKFISGDFLWGVSFLFIFSAREMDEDFKFWRIKWLL